MLVLAASFGEWFVPALVWFVLFPALVTTLIGIAVAQALGERSQNREGRVRRGQRGH